MPRAPVTSVAQPRPIQRRGAVRGLKEWVAPVIEMFRVADRWLNDEWDVAFFAYGWSMWGIMLGFLLGFAGELLASTEVTLAGCGLALSTLFLLKVATTRRYVLLGLGLSFAVVACVVLETGPVAVLTSTLLAIGVATRVLVTRSERDPDEVGGSQHRRLNAAGIRAAQSAGSVEPTEDRAEAITSETTGV